MGVLVLRGVVVEVCGEGGRLGMGLGVLEGGVRRRGRRRRASVLGEAGRAGEGLGGVVTGPVGV